MKTRAGENAGFLCLLFHNASFTSYRVNHLGSGPNSRSSTSCSPELNRCILNCNTWSTNPSSIISGSRSDLNCFPKSRDIYRRSLILTILILAFLLFILTGCPYLQWVTGYIRIIFFWTIFWLIGDTFTTVFNWMCTEILILIYFNCLCFS